MKPRVRVFLSHAAQDEKAASALRTALGDAGFETLDVLRIASDPSRASRRVVEALRRIQAAA